MARVCRRGLLRGQLPRAGNVGPLRVARGRLVRLDRRRRCQSDLAERQNHRHEQTLVAKTMSYGFCTPCSMTYYKIRHFGR